MCRTNGTAVQDFSNDLFLVVKEFVFRQEHGSANLMRRSDYTSLVG
jgi:hypothetical protein